MKNMRNKIGAVLAGVAAALLLSVPIAAVAEWFEATGIPVQRSAISSAEFRSEFALIESGISNKLPTYTGNGDNWVVVNAGGTALTSITNAAAKTLLAAADPTANEVITGQWTFEARVDLDNGTALRLYDSTDADFAAFSHDGTDFNTAFTTTTDWNVTGITVLSAGTVDADFDAITATSYGGITEANLVDKSATETIAGAWTLPEASITAHEAAIDHDALTNFLAAEHLDWTADLGGTNLHANNSANGSLALAAGEVTQLANIGATTISSGDWTAVAALGGTNTGDESAASLTVQGIVELATIAETNTGTDATRGVTPDGLDGWTGNSALVTSSNAALALAAGEVTQLANIGATTITSGDWTAVAALVGTNTGDESAASLTVQGIVELATIAETNTGTDATRAVTPDGLDGWTGNSALVTSSNAALALASGEVTQLANIGATTISSGDWTAVAALVGTNTGDEPAASTTVAGIVERATQAEVNAGTNTTLYIAPDELRDLVTPNLSASEQGYKGAPLNTQNGNYTLVLLDSGKTIFKASGASGETYTIPANASVAFPIGTIIVILNDGGGTLTLAITSDTLRQAVTGSTGSRTLADNAMITIIKARTTTWFVSGGGVT